MRRRRAAQVETLMAENDRLVRANSELLARFARLMAAHQQVLAEAAVLRTEAAGLRTTLVRVAPSRLYHHSITVVSDANMSSTQKPVRHPMFGIGILVQLEA